jgi:hypothetical protein
MNATTSLKLLDTIWYAALLQIAIVSGTQGWLEAAELLGAACVVWKVIVSLGMLGFFLWWGNPKQLKMTYIRSYLRYKEVRQWAFIPVVVFGVEVLGLLALNLHDLLFAWCLIHGVAWLIVVCTVSKGKKLYHQANLAERFNV